MKCQYCGTQNTSDVCPNCGGVTEAKEEAEGGNWEPVVSVISWMIATLLVGGGFWFLGDYLIDFGTKWIPIFSPF